MYQLWIYALAVDKFERWPRNIIPRVSVLPMGKETDRELEALLRTGQILKIMAGRKPVIDYKRF